MKQKIIKWLELDKTVFESPKRIAIKTLKMLPHIALTVFLYIALIKMGEGFDRQSVIGQIALTIPTICYCVWGMMVFIIVLKQPDKAKGGKG